MTESKADSRPLLARRVPLPGDEAADRISAYVYGNLLLLSALVLLSDHDVSVGHGALLAAGTAISTFVAHLFAEVLGAQARETTHGIGVLLRDSVPVLSAATVPVVILILGWQDVLGAGSALRIAEGFIIVRIGLTSFMLARLRNERATLLTLLGSIGLALIALLVVALKTFLTH